MSGTFSDSHICKRGKAQALLFEGAVKSSVLRVRWPLGWAGVYLPPLLHLGAIGTCPSMAVPPAPTCSGLHAQLFPWGPSHA